MKPKQERISTTEFLAKEAARIKEKYGDPLKHRYYIEEVQPAHLHSDEYDDHWVSEKVVDTMGYWDTREEAEQAMRLYEPSSSGSIKNFLRIGHQTFHEWKESGWRQAY